VECRTLQILDELWNDYCTGHLNAMVQKFLVTEDILKLFGLIEVKLTTTILEEDYRNCRAYLKHYEGNNKTPTLVKFFRSRVFKVTIFYWEGGGDGKRLMF